MFSVKILLNTIILNTADHRQAHISASAAKIQHQTCSAELTAVIASCHRRVASVLCAPLLIPCFTALKTLQQICIVKVIRFKGAGCPGVVDGDSVVSHLVIGKSAVIVPLTPSVLNLFQHIKALAIVTVLDVVGR